MTGDVHRSGHGAIHQPSRAQRPQEVCATGTQRVADAARAIAEERTGGRSVKRGNDSIIGGAEASPAVLAPSPLARHTTSVTAFGDHRKHPRDSSGAVAKKSPAGRETGFGARTDWLG